MTSRRPRRPRFALLLALGLMAGLGALPSRAPGQMMASAPARQVTVFGVVATPGAQGSDDPKLTQVLPQLRELLPGHGFKLAKAESRRVAAGESIRCELGDGFVATSQLISPMDPSGKVQLRFDLALNGVSQYQTIVTTPPNQVFYVNRVLPGGERLVIGIGAR